MTVSSYASCLENPQVIFFSFLRKAILRTSQKAGRYEEEDWL